jgi:hypothetical protein
MIEISLLEKLENLGYFALPLRHQRCVGHIGLLTLLRREPAERVVDFDPQAIHLRLLNWDSKAHWTTFKATTPFPMSRVICPGSLTIQDWNGQRATFFVFGGSMEALDVSPDEKVYSIRSPAPVLELTAAESTIADQLAIEVEALWAELQISWGMDDEAFWRQLTRIDSFRLFVAISQAILNHYEQMPDLYTSQNRQALYHALQLEKSWLQQAGQWPDPVPSLDELRQW